MSEQNEYEEQEMGEGEEENTPSNPQPTEGGGSITVEQEAEEPGCEEPDLQDMRPNPDVSDTQTQADLPDDGEQLPEPQPGENAGTSTATVKLVLVPEGHVMTVAFAIGLSIQELKHHLAAELRVPAEVLRICVDGRAVEEQQSLMALGVQPHGSTRMELSSTDPSSHPLRPVRPPEHDNMPDVLTVRVPTDEGLVQEVVVEMERPQQRKPFLGGYRHRLTGAEYHHGATQTLAKARPPRGAEVFSRDTQTVELKSRLQQCPADASTQTTRSGCYLSCVNDKLVVPSNRYTSADEYHERRLNAAIRLQTYARRWLAMQVVQSIRRERDRRLAWLDLQERRRREEKEHQLRDRRQRWMKPQRREDFDLLYQAIERWRREEEQQIDASLRGAERKAALVVLLEQETQFIAAISCHRIAIQSSNYDKAVRSFLDKAAAPRRWRAADGRPLEMETPHSIRARALRDLYHNIQLVPESPEDRLSTLSTLRHTVTEHPCQLTQDIVDLIDREVDLMGRRLKAESLDGLRQRISSLFLQFMKTPAFNPAVAELLKVPQNPSELKNNMFHCRSCGRFLNATSFRPSATSRSRGSCNDCMRLDNVARSRNDSTHYRNILKRLRADEQQLHDQAKIPFLLQVEDVRYLVKVVWASCSALSGSKDLDDLVFIRWDRQTDWSPWNCILLSKYETAAHMEVDDLHKRYETTFVRRIKQRHLLARRHFSHMSTMSQYLDSQPPAALDNQLVSTAIAMATGKHAANAAAASHR
ncbi:uncharacterized protein V6R79_007803 [Siganus canaliculatus]